jgi:formylglycine-generating enzyme required for sulfatase activity
MKKTLLAGLATVLFLLTSTGIAMAGDDAKNKEIKGNLGMDWPLTQEDWKNSKTTGLYDNVTILQEQINSLTKRIGRIETLHGVGPRFTDMGDGTIRDNDSGLFWLKEADCFGMRNWSDAMASADSLAHGQCGLADGSVALDWRLPTKTEWEAFYSSGYDNPALVNTLGNVQWSEGDAFTSVVSQQYWSKTEAGHFNEMAWTADMRSGYMFEELKDNAWDMLVWPVKK